MSEADTVCDGDLAEGEACRDAAAARRTRSPLRIGPDLLIMLFVVYASHVLASIVVGSGMRRDILAAGCQLLVGLGLVLGVRRPASGREAAIAVLGILGVTAIYWVVVRSSLDLRHLPIVVCGAIAWLNWESILLDYYPGGRSLLVGGNLTERARGAYRTFVLVVCAVVVACLFVCFPRRGESPTGVYPVFLATVAGALVCYTRFRLTLLERTLSESSSGTSELGQESGRAPCSEGGPP